MTNDNLDLFLENVQKYIETNGLNLEASTDNKLLYKNLILKNGDGTIQTYKIEDLKTLPPANMCHSSILFIKVNPYNQTDKWLETILKENVVKNKIKMK